MRSDGSPGDAPSTSSAGDELRFPDGTHWMLEQMPDDDADGSLVFVVTLPPGGLTPPSHRHPQTVETFEVLTGALAVKVDRSWRTLTAGDRLEVAPDTPHTFANRSGAEVRIRNSHTPASHFREFVVHVDRLMRARGITRAKDPRVPLLMSMLTLEYPATLAPGRRADALLTRGLAGFGRALRLSTEV